MSTRQMKMRNKELAALLLIVIVTAVIILSSCGSKKKEEVAGIGENAYVVYKYTPGGSVKAKASPENNNSSEIVVLPVGTDVNTLPAGDYKPLPNATVTFTTGETTTTDAQGIFDEIDMQQDAPEALKDALNNANGQPDIIVTPPASEVGLKPTTTTGIFH